MRGGGTGKLRDEGNQFSIRLSGFVQAKKVANELQASLAAAGRGGTVGPKAVDGAMILAQGPLSCALLSGEARQLQIDRAVAGLVLP